MGKTPIKILTVDTIDISEYIDFEFNDLCWYWENYTDMLRP